MKKKYLAAHGTSEYCFCQFADRKSVSLTPKYYLLASYTDQISNFCPSGRKKWVNSIDLFSKLFLTEVFNVNH